MSSPKQSTEQSDSYPISDRIKRFEETWNEIKECNDVNPIPWHVTTWFRTCYIAGGSFALMAWRQAPWYSYFLITGLCTFTNILAFRAREKTTTEDPPESGLDSKGSGEAR